MVVVVYTPGAVVLPWSHILSFEQVHLKFIQILYMCFRRSCEGSHTRRFAIRIGLSDFHTRNSSLRSGRVQDKLTFESRWVDGTTYIVYYLAPKP